MKVRFQDLAEELDLNPTASSEAETVPADMNHEIGSPRRLMLCMLLLACWAVMAFSCRSGHMHPAQAHKAHLAMGEHLLIPRVVEILEEDPIATQATIQPIIAASSSTTTVSTMDTDTKATAGRVGKGSDTAGMSEGSGTGRSRSATTRTGSSSSSGDRAATAPANSRRLKQLIERGGRGEGDGVVPQRTDTEGNQETRSRKQDPQPTADPPSLPSEDPRKGTDDNSTPQPDPLQDPLTPALPTQDPPGQNSSAASQDPCLGCAGSFCITLNLDLVETSYQAAFHSAAMRWCNIITESIGTLEVQRESLCPGAEFAVANQGERVKDVKIVARTTFIDGPNFILGAAGPCFTRPSSGLTWMGVMDFDSADMHELQQNGQLESVVLHEMGHVLGFGTISKWGELVPACSRDKQDASSQFLPYFNGQDAKKEYDTIFPTAQSSRVPVEYRGGSGIVCAHWDEDVFNNELMTGRLNPANNPLSRVSLAALADLGYKVDKSKADSYEPKIGVPTPRLASLVTEGGGSVHHTPEFKPWRCNINLVMPIP